MPRFSAFLPVVTLAFAGVVALGAQPAVVAQEATPAVEGMAPAGITYEPVSAAVGAEVSSPSDIFLVRIGLDSGIGFPIEENDPTVGMLLVEEGAFTVLVDGPLTVTRGAGFGEAMAAAEESGDFSTVTEAVPEGEAVTLEAGDAAFIPGNVSGEIRNDGDARAVGLGFLIFPSEGPMDTAGEATPEP